MNIGDVFFWATSQAVGHSNRSKFHIYVCPEDWADCATFLFINKGEYGEDIALLQSNYVFLAYDSYVSSSGVASYTQAEIAAFGSASVGKLSQNDLKALRDLVLDSRVLERVQKKRIGEALHTACSD